VHPLHACWLKLNRARAHLETLDGEIAAWLAQKPYEVFGEYEPGPPEDYVFRVRFFAPVPPEWGLLVGDFAHNARSALDQLAWQLVLESGGTPSKRTQFPILVDPVWDSAEGKERLDGANKRFLDLVEECQPYKRADPERPAERIRIGTAPLSILAALNNEDKHRVLNTTPAAIQSIGYDAFPGRDVESVDVSGSEVFLGPLEDGEKMLRIPIVSNGPEPEVKLQRQETIGIEIGYRIEFADRTWVTGKKRIIEILSAILEEEWSIFEVFVNEFR
jgi:hypothetical protein